MKKSMTTNNMLDKEIIQKRKKENDSIFSSIQSTNNNNNSMDNSMDNLLHNLEYGAPLSLEEERVSKMNRVVFCK